MAGTQLLENEHNHTARENLSEQLARKWVDWTKQIKHCPKMVQWWERVVKTKLKWLFIGEGTEKRREETQMQNFYYICLYEAIKQLIPHVEKTTMINRLKAKILQIHTTKLARGQLELKAQDILQEERMSLFQLIKRRHRRKQRSHRNTNPRQRKEDSDARHSARL
jgi:hypothetical protein